MCHRGDFGPEWGREREELAEKVDADEADEELPAFATEADEKEFEVVTDGGDGD